MERRSSRAPAVRGSAMLPSKSRKNMYSHGRPGRGRDSSLVIEWPLLPRTSSERISAPCSWRVTKMRLVLQGALRSTADGLAREHDEARVVLGLVGDATAQHPQAMGGRRLRGCRSRPGWESPVAATARIASPASRWRTGDGTRERLEERRALLEPVEVGEHLADRRRAGCSLTPARQWSTLHVSSPTIDTSFSRSRSYDLVDAARPMVFSMGSTARSTLPP